MAKDLDLSRPRMRPQGSDQISQILMRGVHTRRIACLKTPTNDDLLICQGAIGSITIVTSETSRKKYNYVKEHAIHRWMQVFVHINEMACFHIVPPNAGLCLSPVSRGMVTRFSNSSTPHITTSIENVQQDNHGISSTVTAFAPGD